MRFDVSKIRHMVSNIDDILFMSGCCQPINISFDCEDDTQDKMFAKLSFLMLNGKSEIRIYQDRAFLLYLDITGEILQKIEFNNSRVRELHSSFNLALDQILMFDRQHSI
jgi:hypothetical protein